ncbi:MAG: hypothetical protein ACKO0W_05775, partial [Planctomycetota bacterium]
MPRRSTSRSFLTRLAATALVAAAAGVAGPALGAPNSCSPLAAALAGKSRLAASATQSTSTAALAGLPVRIEFADGSFERPAFVETAPGVVEARARGCLLRGRIQNSVSTSFELEVDSPGGAVRAIVLGGRPNAIAFDAGSGELCGETPGSSLGAPAAMRTGNGRFEMLEPVRIGSASAAGDLF